LIDDQSAVFKVTIVKALVALGKGDTSSGVKDGESQTLRKFHGIISYD